MRAVACACRAGIYVKGGTLGVGYSISEALTARVGYTALNFEQDVNINGVVYHASDIGTLSGTVDFDSTVPYFGVGWGNVVGKEGNLHFIADIGVEYLGSPNVNLHGSCTASFQASNAAACAQLQGDIQAEEKSLENQVSDYKWWPVINIGLAYRF